MDMPQRHSCQNSFVLTNEAIGALSPRQQINENHTDSLRSNELKEIISCLVTFYCLVTCLTVFKRHQRKHIRIICSFSYKHLIKLKTKTLLHNNSTLETRMSRTDRFRSFPYTSSISCTRRQNFICDQRNFDCTASLYESFTIEDFPECVKFLP